MECSRCDQRYDQDARQPKLLPCGHTFCVPCLQGAGQCFSDGKAFPGVDCLPDDQYTLSLVTGDIRRHPDDPGPGALQLWCRGCSAAASDCCVDDGHELVPSRVRWHEEVLERLEALAAALDDSDPHEEDEALEQLVGSAGVTVTLVDGDDVLTSTVQLGGSGEEGSDESWALRDLLLLALRGQAKEGGEVAAPPGAPPTECVVLGLGDALFDVDPNDAKYAPFDTYADPEECGYGIGWDDELAVVTEKKTHEEVSDLGCGLFGYDLTEDADMDAGMAALEDEDPEEYCALDVGLPTKPNLDKLKQVRKITALNCLDPGGMEALREVAPYLEELEVRNLRRKHLVEIQGLARLRRLEVRAPDMWTDPFLVPPLEHDGGLEFLRVCLSAPTAGSLIYAHNRTLRHVQVLSPPRRRRQGSLHSIYFETLDYHLGGHVSEHVRRSPYFPRCEPGDFPVLRRVEFIEEPRSPYVINPSWIVGKDMDRIERMLPPGVSVELVFKPKRLG